MENFKAMLEQESNIVPSKHNDYVFEYDCHRQQFFKKCYNVLKHDGIENLTELLTIQANMKIDRYNESTFADSKYKRDFSRELLKKLPQHIISEESF